MNPYSVTSNVQHTIRCGFPCVKWDSFFHIKSELSKWFRPHVIFKRLISWFELKILLTRVFSHPVVVVASIQTQSSRNACIAEGSSTRRFCNDSDLCCFTNDKQTRTTLDVLICIISTTTWTKSYPLTPLYNEKACEGVLPCVSGQNSKRMHSVWVWLIPSYNLFKGTAGFAPVSDCCVWKCFKIVYIFDAILDKETVFSKSKAPTWTAGPAPVSGFLWLNLSGYIESLQIAWNSMSAGFRFSAFRTKVNNPFSMIIHVLCVSVLWYPTRIWLGSVHCHWPGRFDFMIGASLRHPGVWGILCNPFVISCFVIKRDMSGVFFGYSLCKRLIFEAQRNWTAPHSCVFTWTKLISSFVAFNLDTISKTRDS